MSAVALGLAGCVEISNYHDRDRRLSTGNISVVSESGAGLTLEVEISKSATGGDDEWETFHDVRLLGYTDEGTLVCERSLGDIRNNGDVGTVRLQCDRFPAVITFDARESPCDDDTELKVAFYKGKREEVGHYWLAEENRRCNEGLPPGTSQEEVDGS